MGKSIIVEDIQFQSEGYTLKGRTYKPATEGKYPAVAICHGFPGDNKNMDLAEELALNDIAVLVFYYRGAWGSEGSYRLTYLEPSTRDAINYLKSLPNVDTERVGLVSHSMGAVTLTKRLSQDKSIKTGVLMAPAADLSQYTGNESLKNIVPVFMKMAEGKLTDLSEESLSEDLVKAAGTVNPVDNVGAVTVPLLVIVGTADTVTTPESCRKLYDAANEPKEWVAIEGADHSFTEHRIPLTNKIIKWLKVHL
ncbi:MAG: alpha/beta hydrolase [Candidatus Bathyarchaeota archaeon]|nr:alpha/beta hydrolase [Candidatus Bathyarchaeota archaeon]